MELEHYLLFQLSRSALFNCVGAIIHADRERTEVRLTRLLINYYAVIVVVVSITANATTVSATATIVAIDKVTLWFISQGLSSTLLYLRCFTASANNLGEIVDIFKL